MSEREFAVFILTHGRPDNVRTLKALKKGNYSGRVYLVIDNEDGRGDEYRERYGDMVVEFDKLAVSKTFDTADLSEDRRAIVYARNACFDIAEGLGITHFLELDDDYNYFAQRYVNENGKLSYRYVYDLDKLFGLMCDFLDESEALSVAFAQGGDFIGGANSGNFRKRVLRKCMNTFFCRTDRRFQFVGRINEDVNTYTSIAARGGLFMTVCDVSIEQTDTQQGKGGMTSLYLDGGTFLKSFYSVIFAPSCVTVRMMGDGHSRMHHHVKWRYAVPMILSDKWRKA
jgi:hypothetical protein